MLKIWEKNWHQIWFLISTPFNGSSLTCKIDHVRRHLRSNQHLAENEPFSFASYVGLRSNRQLIFSTSCFCPCSIAPSARKLHRAGASAVVSRALGKFSKVAELSRFRNRYHQRSTAARSVHQKTGFSDLLACTTDAQPVIFKFSKHNN